MIEFQFSAQAEGWVESLCHNKFATVKILSLKPDGNDVTHFVEISSERFPAEELDSNLDSAKDIKGRDLAKVGPNRLIGAVTSSGCQVCAALVESNTNCFVAPAVTEDNCKIDYKLFISGEGLPGLLQKMHEKHVELKISDVSPLSLKRKMTERQEKVLRSALELGYFDYPKRISSDELSKILNIRASTLSEILRRAEKNVIKRYFEGEAS